MILVILLFLLGANVASAESLNDQILAKRDGDASLSELIAREVNINAIKEDGFTPLTFASRLCRPKTAQLLLNAGADMNKIDEYGVPPLFHTIVENCAILTKILIDYGADARWVDTENGNNLLHYASVWGADSEVYDLINAGADINRLNRAGESPLRVLLNWPDVAPWFKEERAELFKKYGAKDVSTRPEASQTQPKPSKSERRKDQLDAMKRRRKRSENQQMERRFAQ